MRNSPKWREFLYSSVMYASKDRVFVIWDYTPDGPKLVTALVVEDVGISLQSGVTVKLHDVVNDELIVLEHQPRQVARDVFMWVPQFMDMRFAPDRYKDMRGTWRLSLPLCVKTATHPTKDLTQGHRYISTQADFESRWPNLK